MYWGIKVGVSLCSFVVLLSNYDQAIEQLNIIIAIVKPRIAECEGKKYDINADIIVYWNVPDTDCLKNFNWLVGEIK